MLDSFDLLQYNVDNKESIMERIKAEIRPATKEYPRFTVIVRELKFDTIRQSEGWVAKEVKTYRLRSDAETYAARFGWKG